jgi:acylphosphatase
MNDAAPLVVRARVAAFGRVQGVFYRDTLRQAAVEHGVTGSAINLADGSVVAVFEGARADVDAMIEFARVGSASADVERLEVIWQHPEGLTRFETG